MTEKWFIVRVKDYQPSRNGSRPVQQCPQSPVDDSPVQRIWSCCQVAEGLRKSEALMQGHGHPGALEALGLEALEVSKREDSLVMLGYQVAPIGAAKILE